MVMVIVIIDVTCKRWRNKAGSYICKGFDSIWNQQLSLFKVLMAMVLFIDGKDSQYSQVKSDFRTNIKCKGFFYKGMQDNFENTYLVVSLPYKTIA